MYVSSNLAQFRAKASTYAASGSGFHEQNLGSCLFKRDAKRSMHGVPKIKHNSLKISMFSCHSCLSLKFCEAVSTKMLHLPGI